MAGTHQVHSQEPRANAATGSVELLAIVHHPAVIS